MSESPSEVANKRSLRRRHSSSPNLSKIKKSMSKSRSMPKYESRSSSRSSSNKSRSHSIRKSNKGNKRTSSSSKAKRHYSRSRSYRNERRSRKYSRSKSPPRYSKFNRLKNDIAEPCTCIGIFGLSKRTKEETLWDTFQKYGKIDNVRLIMDRGKRESLGYAFIDYKEIESAIKAMKEAHGTDIDGNNIRLDYSVGKKPANSRYFKDKQSSVNRYDSKYRNNGHRDYRRRSRSRTSRSSRGSYRKRRDSRKGRSRSRRSRSSRGSYRKRRDSIRRRSRSKNSRGSRSSYKRRRISSKRRSHSRRSTNSRNSSR